VDGRAEPAELGGLAGNEQARHGQSQDDGDGDEHRAAAEGIHGTRMRQAAPPSL